MAFNISILIIGIIIFSLINSLLWLIIQLFGFLYHISKTIFFNRTPYAPLTYKPKISVIIPARNEANVIANLIFDLKQQIYDNFEILVAANNCTDDGETVKAALSIEDDRIKVLEFDTQVKGKGAALNHALKSATGEIICIFDADNRVNQNFLFDIRKYFYDDAVDGVQARYKVSNLKEGLIPKFVDLETMIYVECFQDFCELFNINTYFGGTGMCIRKRIIDEFKWGDTLVEDYELSLNMISKNHVIIPATNCEVYDEKPVYWDDLITQRRRWIKGDFQVLKLFYSQMFKPLHYILLLAPINLLLYVFILSFYWFSVFTGFKYFSYTYIPLSYWLPLYAVSISIPFVIVLFKDPKKLLLVPFYLFIFAYHWILVLVFALFTKDWNTTKSTHYGSVLS